MRGSLRISTILDPEFTRLGAFLKELVESAPQIETTLRQGMSGEVLAQIERGELDVGFYLGLPQDFEENTALAPVNRSKLASQFIAKTLSSFTYRVVAPVGWGPQVLGRDWKTLAALPWLATPSVSARHRLLQAVFGPGCALAFVTLRARSGEGRLRVRWGRWSGLGGESVPRRNHPQAFKVMPEKPAPIVMRPSACAHNSTSNFFHCQTTAQHQRGDAAWTTQGAP